MEELINAVKRVLAAQPEEPGHECYHPDDKKPFRHQGELCMWCELRQALRKVTP